MISTQNRFAYWEEDDSSEPELQIDEGTKQLSTVNETRKKRKEKKKKLSTKIACSRKSRESSNFKKCLAGFNTQNSFNVFEKYTQEEIEKISCGDMLEESATNPRKKCKLCGYKTKCYLQENCKAQDKICFACFHPNHFPKSPNCKIQKRKKEIHSKVLYGCITLRQFLKISGYKLTTRVIPYIELLEKIKVKNDVDGAQIKESQKL